MSALRSWFKLSTLLTLALPVFLGLSGCSDDDAGEEGDDETPKMSMEVEVNIAPHEGAEATDEESSTESTSEAQAWSSHDHSADVSEEPASSGADE